MSFVSPCGNGARRRHTRWHDFVRQAIWEEWTHDTSVSQIDRQTRHSRSHTHSHSHSHTLSQTHHIHTHAHTHTNATSIRLSPCVCWWGAHIPSLSPPSWSLGDRNASRNALGFCQLYWYFQGHTRVRGLLIYFFLII